MAVKLQAIPHVSTVPGVSQGLGLVLTAIRNTLEVREGRLGDPLDKHLTQRETLALLVRLGVITQAQADAES